MPVNFTATVSDQKDGNWPLKSYSTNGPTVITWSSDVDGTYVYNGNDGGTSIPIDFTHAPEGVRHITATVTDSAGLTSIANLTVNIQFPHNHAVAGNHLSDARSGPASRHLHRDRIRLVHRSRRSRQLRFAPG